MDQIPSSQRKPDALTWAFKGCKETSYHSSHLLQAVNTVLCKVQRLDWTDWAHLWRSAPVHWLSGLALLGPGGLTTYQSAGSDCEAQRADWEVTCDCGMARASCGDLVPTDFQTFKNCFEFQKWEPPGPASVKCCCCVLLNPQTKFTHETIVWKCNGVWVTSRFPS